jgi:hypothetical protein
VRADYAVIHAQAVGFGNRHIGLTEGMDDSILAINLVGRLGQQLARRLLP